MDVPKAVCTLKFGLKYFRDEKYTFNQYTYIFIQPRGFRTLGSKKTFLEPIRLYHFKGLCLDLGLDKLHSLYAKALLATWVKLKQFQSLVIKLHVCLQTHGWINIAGQLSYSRLHNDYSQVKIVRYHQFCSYLPQQSDVFKTAMTNIHCCQSCPINLRGKTSFISFNVITL